MIKPINAYIFVMFFASLAWGSTVTGEQLWLSDTAPFADHGSKHSHGGPVQVRRGVYYKHLWLRHGSSPQESGYVEQITSLSAMLLIDTEGKVSESPVGRDKEHGFYNIDFAMPKEGFYNAYVIRQRVFDGLREVEVAKAEVLKHSCREGHDNVQEKMPPRHSERVPLEIVRERLPKENFHSLVSYGDSVSFLVLREGTPQPGAVVSLTTGQGWSKSAISDSDGRVSYKLIRDYYPPWYRFKKRHAQPYLLNASYTLSQSGELEGQPFQRTIYRSSIAGNYYPSARDYESYAFGLTLGLLALLLTGIAVYIYRRRRHRPFPEVRFDD